MKSYLALINVTLKLAMRERSVLFFNYLFPLIFFFAFGQFMGAKAGGTLTRVISMVLVIGVLGSGLFGAGMRTVAEREANILRRYKVTPISPLPILVANIISGWVLYIPAVLLILGLSHFIYGMPWPANTGSLLLLVSVGICTFRSLGLIIASVANSMAESNILIQLLYMPMLFISGATIPISLMPTYMQAAAQFLPASYLNSGIQRILLRGETIATTLGPVAALIACMILATFISYKLFRWEKEQKIAGNAKMWVAAVLLPFVVMGGYQAYSKEHVNEAKLLDRQIRRANPRLIRGGRIFVGDGTVIEKASILTKNGRIQQIITGTPPDADDIGAELIEAAGKTVLPGFIDLHVHLGAPGALLDKPADFDAEKIAEHALAAQLYGGVTAVRPAGILDATILAAAARVNRGGRLGAEVLLNEAALAAGQTPGAASMGEAFQRALAKLVPDGRSPLMPALALRETLDGIRAGRSSALETTLAQQVVAPAALAATRSALAHPPDFLQPYFRIPVSIDEATAAFQQSISKGEAVALGTGSGAFAVLHGSAVHRELYLWVKAGATPAQALRAATYEAARAAGVDKRMGMIAEGMLANLVIVDGNALQDIAATERISDVLFWGEHISRQDLFEQK
jgi:imidazolonepropionase-like amidohydrolase/ABC-type multidrug transport system permease subunit